MYFLSIYENRRMKLVEIVSFNNEGGRREREEGEQWRRVNLRYIVSTYANITIYPPVQLLYANKIIFKSCL
jgi:hypothetical protein